jgi:hypothetical protein
MLAIHTYLLSMLAIMLAIIIMNVGPFHSYLERWKARKG